MSEFDQHPQPPSEPHPDAALSDMELVYKYLDAEVREKLLHDIKEAMKPQPGDYDYQEGGTNG